MRVSSRSISVYVAITCLSVILILNPVVVTLLTTLQVAQVSYLVVFDFALAAIFVLSILHIKCRRVRYLTMSIICVVGLPFLMAFTEVAVTYARLLYGNRWNNIVTQNLHRPDPFLGWSVIPNAQGRHISPGNYDAIYYIDNNGRKAIPDIDGVDRTVHFFGNSMTFGQGVSNKDTALNLLSGEIGDKFNVLNYGVIGYGIGQMFIHFRSNLANIMTGDVVVFSPLSMDLMRNFIYKEHYCRYDYSEGYSVQRLPAFRNGRWIFPRLRDECNGLETMILTSYRLPLGTLYRWYKKTVTRDSIIDNADQIFSQAAQLTHKQGAKFLLVLLTTPAECRVQTFDVDIDQLSTPFLSLMSYCPSEIEVLDQLAFPKDLHWSAFGNRWAAQALEDLLKTQLLVL